MDDDKEALAAEYVLGTLSADERDQTEARLTIDPTFAAAVQQWERRLGELNVMVEAVEPPPELWDQIKADIKATAPDQPLFEFPAAEPQLDIPAVPAEETALSSLERELAADSAALSGGPSEPIAPSVPAQEARTSAPSDLSAKLAAGLLAELEAEVPAPPPRIERSGEVIYLARRVSRWRRLTLAAGAIAALLALYVGVSQFAPGLLPAKFAPSQLIARSEAPPAAPGSRLVAVLAQEPIAPAFLLTIDPQARTMTVRRVSASAEANRSYELWLISSKFPNPRSLGIVGKDEFTARPIPANFDADTVRGASYAVSLEPAGGSPSGVPTGPVLFTGKLVESVPAPHT